MASRIVARLVADKAAVASGCRFCSASAAVNVSAGSGQGVTNQNAHGGYHDRGAGNVNVKEGAGAS